jgi:hypothetical protein
MKKLPRVLALIATVGTIAAMYAFRPADTGAWTADYLELREILARSYANLGYASGTGLPLHALDSTARWELSRSKTVRGARAAISRFVSAFGDPHLHVISGPPKPVGYLSNLYAPTDVQTIASGVEACAAMGYGDGIGDGYSLPFEKLAGFRMAQLEDNLFSAASAPGAGGKRVGIIRITLFSPHKAKGQCEKAWSERRSESSGHCNAACQDSVYYRTGELLAETLRKSVLQLENEGVSSILVDLGGNGGGSEWVVHAVRAVTGSPLSVHATLITKAEGSRRCRWEEAIAQRCSNLIPVDPDPETVAALEENSAPKPVRPLFVLVDAGTASASEYFAAVLRDNNAARIIGARTMGAGCGYIDGGGEFVLPRTGLRVRVPNCVRIRKDGTNERAGIRPDIELSSDSPGGDRARQVLAVASQGNR